ncbi:hypothetical protein EW145_g1375 [Phellinidium pouzarii]|uniref:Uncharacterized protein n=1 Tax=Phellinidium pouzarii TaxID=167371 RepID=A0A4S4LFC1_9AGAM|nr:hypothetical protein EW145_g1375 [Phellinidium pouzarii]
MPPTSRTPSTQATPKINKGKAPQSSKLAQESETSLSNCIDSSEVNYSGPQFSDDALFSDDSSPRKPLKDKSKGKRKTEKFLMKRKRRQPSSRLDLFSRMFIVVFLVYALTVCRTAKQQSPVCRGLSIYRQLILEPYVITPFQNLLRHPTVSPYATPVINVAKPVINRTQKEWDERVVPQWNARVVPQWKRHIVPQWNAHVTPYIAILNAKVDPYWRTASDSYYRNIAPYVAHVRRVACRTQPYIILTAAKTYDAYQISKPYLGRVYGRLKRVPPFVVKYVIRPFANARRQFVDPHVALLVEKIKELSSGTAKVPSSNSLQDSITPITTPTILTDTEVSSEPVKVELPLIPESIQEEDKTLASAASVMSASVFLGEQAAESVPGATYSLVLKSEQTESEAERKTVHFTDVETTVETVITQGVVTKTEQLPITETPIQKSVETDNEEHNASTNDRNATVEKVSQAVFEVTHTSADAVISPVSSDTTVVPLFKVPEAHRPSQPVPPSGEAGKGLSDDDLDDFYAELELDVEETTSSTDAVEATPSVVQETEAEEAARKEAHLAAVAERRRDLETRHAMWEDKLAAAVQVQATVLRDALGSIRSTAAAELKTNWAIRDAVEALHTESEKALRGTDAYFAKLIKSEKPRDEQARLWERVLIKVEAKFDERMKGVEQKVNSWYQEEVLSKEGHEIEKASNIVRGTAEDGQADIGLGYAWLDDVTYMDWRRYHALLEKHTEWLDEALALANGSHATPYPNPVMDAFEDLQSEVQDITVGFETRLRRMKREGDRAFSVDTSTDDSMRESEPEFSILPISDDDTAQGRAEEKILQEVSDAILGRSEDEVVAALGRADERVSRGQEEAKVAHEEL